MFEVLRTHNDLGLQLLESNNSIHTIQIMPYAPDHPNAISSVNIAPNGTGTGESVRYEVDNSGTLVVIRQSETGQGTHMRFIYDVPGLANAAQHQYTNIAAQGNATTVGVAVNANGIQAIDRSSAQTPQAHRTPSRSVDSPMAYRDEPVSGMLTPAVNSPVHSRPASPMDMSSPTRPFTATSTSRPPVSTFGSMSIRNQPARSGNEVPWYDPARRQNDVRQQRFGSSQETELQSDDPYRPLARRAEGVRERIQDAIHELDGIHAEHMQLESLEMRRRQQQGGMSQIGSDDVGDLYVEETPEPPLAPTRSTFQQIATPSLSGSEGHVNTLYAGHTPSASFSYPPSPPGEIHIAQRVRFSNQYVQARLLSPESPTTDPDNSRNDWGHFGRHQPTSITRRPHRRALPEEPTDVIYPEESVSRSSTQLRYTSPSEFSNFSTATTEPFTPQREPGSHSNRIAPESLLDIDRAQEEYRRRFPGVDNAHYAGDRTPTNSSPGRSTLPTPASRPLPRRTSSASLLGPHRQAMFPHPDGGLRGHSRELLGSLTREEDSNSSSTRVAERQLSESLSSLSALTSVSSTTANRSATAVERLISVQPETPRNIRESQVPSHNPRPCGVTTRLQAKRQAMEHGKPAAYCDRN